MQEVTIHDYTPTPHECVFEGEYDKRCQICFEPKYFTLNRPDTLLVKLEYFNLNVPTKERLRELAVWLRDQAAAVEAYTIGMNHSFIKQSDNYFYNT